ncbi:MAG: GH3 auxin-responsive promoter family protein [Gemmataceae bacterium]
MPGTAWLTPLTGAKLVRRAADAGVVRAAHFRARQLDRLDAAATQDATLLKLVRFARDTRFGRDHDFATVRSVADYQARVPVRDYDAFWDGYWKAVYPRLQGVTWPDFIPYYALSSGTTTGTTKYIPVSRQMVRSNQKAAFTTTALFRHAHPAAKLFTGKFFFLGGSTDLRKQDDGSLAGDLSGIAAKEVADALRPYSFPPLDLGLLSDWEVKLGRLAEAAVKEPITAVSGVPSWVKILFDRVKQITGKRTVAEVWPMLRLVVHGGTKFDPYRELFVRAIGSDAVKFCEVYPCSEGFVATEDPRYHLLRLVPDHAIFFEFIPVDEFTADGKPPANPTRHTLRTLEVGVQYAVVVTTCAGLWSYLLGDTVTFESKSPPLLRFTGRTKYFLSAFGEHLIQEEIDKAVAHAAKATGADAIDFHVGPLFPEKPGEVGRHLYLIEFAGRSPDLGRFVDTLDTELSRLNEDYAAHRVGDLTMLKPAVRVVPAGGFAEWMKSRGRFGGQNKVPRMDNSGTLTKELAGWLAGR